MHIQSAAVAATGAATGTGTGTGLRPGTGTGTAEGKRMATGGAAAEAAAPDPREVCGCAPGHIGTPCRPIADTTRYLPPPQYARAPCGPVHNTTGRSVALDAAYAAIESAFLSQPCDRSREVGSGPGRYCSPRQRMPFYSRNVVQNTCRRRGGEYRGVDICITTLGRHSSPRYRMPFNSRNDGRCKTRVVDVAGNMCQGGPMDRSCTACPPPASARCSCTSRTPWARRCSEVGQRMLNPVDELERLGRSCCHLDLCDELQVPCRAGGRHTVMMAAWRGLFLSDRH